MIFKTCARIRMNEIGKDNLVTNESILKILENAASEHSCKVGYGVFDALEKGVGWILVGWKVKILKRPLYNDEIFIETWGRDFIKASMGRDFRVTDSNGDVCIIATSKWAMIDINTHRIIRIKEDVWDVYKPENIRVFEEDLDNIDIPENFSNVIEYKVGRRDIDNNKHMHNTNYLDLAYEAMPEEVFENRPYNFFEIKYKKEILLGDVVKCKYAFVDNKHVIVCTTNDDSTTNAIIELYN